jgi:5-formyltetrahydrofolate cyclo-ligase
MNPETLATTRREWRKQLLQRRQNMPADQRIRADAALDAQLRAALEGCNAATLGFYWPIQAEFDARPAVSAWLAQRAGRRAALPVVIARNQPVRFRDWTPDTIMQAAGFGTSVPSAGEWLIPTVLAIPLVGFDDAGYRLGYGGGYYDRTMAALSPRPHAIGIGYADCRLASIDPQPYDLKLDVILAA